MISTELYCPTPTSSMTLPGIVYILRLPIEAYISKFNVSITLTDGKHRRTVSLSQGIGVNEPLLGGASVRGVGLVARGCREEVMRGDAWDILLLLLSVLTHIRSGMRDGLGRINRGE